MPSPPNPFQVTNPVGPDEVIDRDPEAAQLVALANEGNNARLVAPRRYGKTSLVRRVQAELGRGDWTTVYVDLLGIVTLEDFAGRIERAYTAVLTGAMARWFTALRRTLQPTFTLGGGPIPASGSIDLAGRARDALIDRLALPVKVYEKTGLRVHIVFDEFQELDMIDGQADAVVRSEIQHHADAASYVFAGSRVHMMEMLFADRKRAFYGQTQPVNMHPLDPVDLAAYIASRFAHTGKEITAEALDSLLELVAGHPQRAMAAAHALWDATDATASLDEWEVARTGLWRDVVDELRTSWGELTANERQALVGVATGEGPYRRNAPRPRGASVANALAGLEGQGVIVRNGTSWMIVDPLLAEWVRQGRDPS